MKKLTIPVTFTPDQRKYLLDQFGEVGKEITDCVGKREAIAEILLVSPSKKVYSLSVADDGSIVTTLVQE